MLAGEGAARRAENAGGAAMQGQMAGMILASARAR
jgi:hypothetical protein